MNAFIKIVSDFIQNSNLTAVALDATIKSFIVLVLAGAGCLCWRRASAATRHLIWLLAVLSLPFLPLLSSILPAWQKPLWSVSAGLAPGNEFALALELAPGARPAFSGVEQKEAGGAARAFTPNEVQLKRGTAMRFDARWLSLVFAAWLVGFLWVLLSIAAGRFQLRALSRKAHRVQDANWGLLLREVCEALDLRRPITVMKSQGDEMPMTWGWWRPVVLLPAEAEQWPQERRRVVLLHELAHVKRWDCLTQLVTRWVCALYWFNPLLWVAGRRMRIERERACDDLVLNCGCRASTYAAHLVEIARTFRRVPQVAAIAMARPSGLERRVVGILDASRNRNRVARATAALIGLAVAGFGVFMGVCATTSPAAKSWFLDQPKVFAQLKRFAAEKEAQASAGAKAEGNEMLPEFRSMFAAAANGDWLTISNIWEDLRHRAPQYEGPGPKDERLHGSAWQTFLETWGAFGNIAIGGPKLTAFGRDAVESIPRGSIYFGGTDPGRCVITGLCKSHVKADPFFTVTQNALADGSYLAYLRRMYGEKIYVPTEADSQRCFQEYVADAQRRLEHDQQFPNEPEQIKPGEDVRMIDGKPQVSGQIAVMAINAVLAKIIFDKNPDREFYLEESFPLDWMYPHLSPNGPIMKINRQPLAELSDTMVRKDREYWTRAIKPLIGDWLTYDTPLAAVTAFAETAPKAPKEDPYIHTDSAQKWASKLRSSIAGIYVWRSNQASDPREKQRMLKEADFAFRQSFAVCPHSPEAVFRYVNLLTGEKRFGDAALVAEAALKVAPRNQQFRNLLNDVHRREASAN